MALAAHLDPLDTHANDAGTARPERRILQLSTSGRRLAGGEANVLVHNASATGLLLETELVLEEGEALALDLPEAGTTLAQVVWRSGSLYGCRFDRAVSEAVLNAAELRSDPGILQFGAPDNSTFGERFQRLRKRQGLTLQQVAEALNVAKPTVWAWEHDRSQPKPDRLKDLAEVLGVAPHDLQAQRTPANLERVVETYRTQIAAELGMDAAKIRIMIEL